MWTLFKSQYFLFIFMFLLCSCYNEDCPPNFSMGELHLQETSKLFIPPIENKSIIYTDSLGNELSFHAESISFTQETIPVASTCFVLLFFNNKETIASMDAEVMTMELTDSLNQVNLRYIISSQTLPTGLEADTVLFDVLTIEKIGMGEAWKRKLGVTESRGNFVPEIDSLLTVEDTILMNKPFQNLLYNQNLSNHLYSKELGLVSFSDNAGKIWIWDRIE